MTSEVVFTQPYDCSIALKCKQADFSRLDNLIHGIDYAKLRQDVLDFSKGQEASQDPSLFLYKVAQFCLDQYSSVVEAAIFLKTSLPKNGPRRRNAPDLGYQLKIGRLLDKKPLLAIISNRHQVYANIGLTEAERTYSQPLRLSCRLHFLLKDTEQSHPSEKWSSLRLQTEKGIKRVLEYVDLSSCKTLEALSSRIVDIVAESNIPTQGHPPLHSIQVSIEKMRVFQDGTIPSVVLTRRFNDFWSSDLFEHGKIKKYDLHRAFVALGSNVGDRLSMIEQACKMMESEGIKVIRTSSLYETKAMYVVDQNQFLNGVCQVGAFAPIGMRAK